MREQLTDPHEQLSAGQVVVVIREDVRQLLERLHAVSAGKHTIPDYTAVPARKLNFFFIIYQLI